jgi:hypothetical protein
VVQVQVPLQVSVQVLVPLQAQVQVQVPAPLEEMECDSSWTSRILPTTNTYRWTSFVVVAMASLWLHW